MPKIHRPMQGIRIWKNEKNKFCVFELHYSADEDKRTEAWKANAKSGLTSAKWKQEYELEWLSFAGQPVYPDWNRRIHGVEYELDAHMGLPLLIGFDFGLTPAAVIAQLQGNQLMVMKEYIGMNIGAKRFVEYVQKQLRTRYPNWANFRRDYLCFIDPSGQFRKDTDEGTCAQILDAAGFNPQPGPVAFEARRTAVEQFLVTMHKGAPTLQVAMNECPTLTKGFDGGYMYPEGALELKADSASPIKNIYSHVHDAFQYLCFGVGAVRMEVRRQFGNASPGYGFQGRDKR